MTGTASVCDLMRSDQSLGPEKALAIVQDFPSLIENDNLNLLIFSQPKEGVAITGGKLMGIRLRHFYYLP